MNKEEVNETVKMPMTVWILGAVSFFSNSAAVVITALTPEFIIHVLGSTAAVLGYIRGFSEALSYLVKLFSGIISAWALRVGSIT